MIALSVLKSAKSFLCWDVFKDLSIQLVPLQKDTAYYYPPDNPLHSIVVYYDPEQQDQGRALYFLFHEAGHVLQNLEYKQGNRVEHFYGLLDQDKGPEKVEFETEAWQKGRKLLDRFLQYEKMNEKLLNGFDRLAEQCIKSYF